MEKTCSICGSELVEGYLAGKYISYFYPKGQEKKLRPKCSKVVCDCCKGCGSIQNMRVVQLEKIT